MKSMGVSGPYFEFIDLKVSCLACALDVIPEVTALSLIPRVDALIDRDNELHEVAPEKIGNVVWAAFWG